MDTPTHPCTPSWGRNPVQSESAEQWGFDVLHPLTIETAHCVNPLAVNGLLEQTAFNRTQVTRLVHVCNEEERRRRESREKGRGWRKEGWIERGRGRKGVEEKESQWVSERERAQTYGILHISFTRITKPRYSWKGWNIRLSFIDPIILWYSIATCGSGLLLEKI